LVCLVVVGGTPGAGQLRSAENRKEKSNPVTAFLLGRLGRCASGWTLFHYRRIRLLCLEPLSASWRRKKKKKKKKIKKKKKKKKLKKIKIKRKEK
jgi:hypothetical protein